MKTNNRLFVDVHVLQTVPPSCINRDDTGSPKTAVYGGVTRARVSSQSWKRAIRLMFKEELSKDKLGVRTKKTTLITMLAEEIKALNSEIDATKAAQRLFEAAGVKFKAKKEGSQKEESDAPFFISLSQIKALANLAIDVPATIAEKPTNEAKKKASDTLIHFPGVDVALFGRMVAEEPSLKTDACAQVAHSISTHKISNEYDYFTAVDELPQKDNAGAAFIGTVEFNSSTLYRYATVAVCELYKQLGNDTIDAVREFVNAFVYSMPTGKQNTFANRTLPFAVLVTLRTNQPINLVGAFERPVPSSDNGYEAISAERLVAHAKSVYQNFAGEPVCSLVTGNPLAELGKELPFSDLLQMVEEELQTRLADCGDAK